MNTEVKQYAKWVLGVFIFIASLFILGQSVNAIGEPVFTNSCEGQKKEIRDFIYQSQIHLDYFSTFTLATNPNPNLQTKRIEGFVNWKRIISQENSFACQEYLELIYSMEESMDLALYLTLIGSTKNLFDEKGQLALEENYTILGNQLIYFMNIVVEKLLYFGIEAKSAQEPVPNS